MNTDSALEFLRDHQPMPSDEELSQELINSYDEVRRFFLEFPDSRAIRLLMNSFGQGDGAGVYQLVEDCFKLYPAAAVVDELILALNSDYESVQYWSTQVSQLYVDSRLMEPLLHNITTVVHCDLLEATLASLGRCRLTRTSNRYGNCQEQV